MQNLADDQIQTQVEVAELAPITVFPNFASIQNLSLKKRQFFDYLEEYVLAENESIIWTRNELKRYVAIADSGVEFSERERYWLLNLADDYRIESEKHSEREILNELMLRIDVLPASLALAQAANESAWGTSRFALQGNNVFGQWCYEAGCGIIPAQRKTGASHEVRLSLIHI